MAISKTTTVQRIEVYPNDVGSDPTVSVTYHIVMDDPDDNELPISTYKAVTLHKSTMDNSDAENPVEVLTDISGEDALVQAVCNAVWAE